MFSALQVSRIFPTVTKSVHSCVYKGTICQMTGLYITKYSNYRIARNLVRGLIWPFSNLRRKVPNKNSHYFSLSFAWLVGSFHVHTHWQKLCRCMVLVERWQTILYTPCATATLHRLFYLQTWLQEMRCSFVSDWVSDCPSIIVSLPYRKLTIFYITLLLLKGTHGGREYKMWWVKHLQSTNSLVNLYWHTHIPYRRNLSREKTFTNRRKIRFRGENFARWLHAPHRQLCVGMVTDWTCVDWERVSWC